MRVNDKLKSYVQLGKALGCSDKTARSYADRWAFSKNGPWKRSDILNMKLWIVANVGPAYNVKENSELELFKDMGRGEEKEKKLKLLDQQVRKITRENNIADGLLVNRQEIEDVMVKQVHEVKAGLAHFVSRLFVGMTGLNDEQKIQLQLLCENEARRLCNNWADGGSVSDLMN